MVDQRGGKPGQFILTGSAVPKDNAVHYTGTGRISRLMMRPMSLFESLESNGMVSLKSLFEGKTNPEGLSNVSIENIASAIVRGGWPASIGIEESAALRHAVDYGEAVINADISRVDGVEKNPARVRALMRSYARNIATMATIKTIRDDIALGDADESISEKTISQYLAALDRIFVTENLPAWNPVLRLTPSRLLEDFQYFGFLFESLCTRDLWVYAEAIDGQVFHYRDASSLESDTVVCLNDGRWAPIGCLKD